MTATAQALRFQNVGMGVALAADWFDVNGSRIWVDFMSTCEGRGKRRTWHVTANHYPQNNAQNGKGTRVTVSRKDCYRYEAAEQALAELTEWLSHNH